MICLFLQFKSLKIKQKTDHTHRYHSGPGNFKIQEFMVYNKLYFYIFFDYNNNYFKKMKILSIIICESDSIYL